MEAQQSFDVCPLALGQYENAVAYADVDGSAFIFADMPATHNVRADLDEIMADTELSFETARHGSAVDLDTVDEDFDMLFIYS